MKAVFVENAEQVKVKEVNRPNIKSDEVLIKVIKAGICGSDIHTYKGLHPFRKPPVIMGHEVAGEVAEVGNDVSKVKVGDRVTVEPQKGTGESEGIMTGNVNYSDERLAPGMGEWLGTMAEYFVAPETLVLSLPDSVSYEKGVLMEPLAVGVHAAFKGEVHPSDRIAILGAGPIGLLTLAAVYARNVKSTLVTDVFDYPLDIARDMGARTTLNIGGKSNWVTEAKEIMGGSFDKVFITAGVPGIINQALHLLKKGGRIVTVAMFQDQQKIDIEQLQQNEKEIVGCMTYNRPDSEEALSIIEDNKIPLEKVISHQLPYEQAADGFRMVDKKEDQSVKVLINFDA
ncbi:alcohol dehydrogenase catalytic domain-containing protein [Salicibibacter cibarius]|uniref:Alcohol dehydrogenase catalytic domain-containing protein n=1 Tax=Salicibibacter cibarius TaxID=2743000 RepID=A0A7T6Z2D9_9BACI|nr:alcohol dehydrogenase catalytic domain-containing protein [Salicibibacter cibarius]QQK75733.1 alcohol dehydrogenase catalytic domain-containing protein [Salicibibacter cibarius]